MSTTLTGKVCFVTGATGFLGGALVKRLSADGVLIKALARSTKKAQKLNDLENVEVVYGDITDISQMREVIAGSEIVFHVAATTGGALDLQLEANLGGTRNVALASAENDIQRLVHVSSIATYGYTARGIIREDTPQNPGNVPYNISKLEAERVLLKVAEETGLSYSIIRPGMIYGSGSGFWTAYF
ncbi:MAG: NAD-dependent epimerase/dehydratase family protein, partial [Anaerolineae bacterium]|nr:NAD-dependent epimerase/dehydratase family protein [Anaerolineae bacterium]